MFKYTNELIERDLELEKDLGISELQIYAYRYEETLRVVGAIKALKISTPFTLALVAYDKKGDIVLTEKNEGYGTGFVTSEISPKLFYDGYPFEFFCWESRISRIAKIKVYPVGE